MTGKSRVGASNKNHNRYCLNILHPKQISTGTVFKQIIESRQQVKNTTGSLESVSASNKNFNRYCFDTNNKAVQQIKNHNPIKKYSIKFQFFAIFSNREGGALVNRCEFFLF